MTITSYLLSAEIAPALATASPWWGVPVITASAVLVGALVAFVSTRASDSRKFKRDKAERIMVDTRSVGLEYLAAASSLEGTIRAQQDLSRELQKREYLRAMQVALMNVQAKWGKFELFADEQALATGKDLDTACLVLFLSAFKGEVPSEELKEFGIAKYAFINTLRKSSGVGEIPYVFPEAQTKDDLDADVAILQQRFDEDLKKNFGTPPPQQ